MDSKEEFQEKDNLLSQNLSINDTEIQSLVGWTTLSWQMFEAGKCLMLSEKFRESKKISNYEDFILQQTMFKNAVLTYAKCFSRSGKGKISLDAKQLFKDRIDFKTAHASIMKMRNTYIAHNDENDYETVLILSKEENEEIILNEEIRFKKLFKDFSKYIVLFHFCSEHINVKLKQKVHKIENRIGKKITFKN